MHSFTHLLVKIKEYQLRQRLQRMHDAELRFSTDENNIIVVENVKRVRLVGL